MQLVFFVVALLFLYAAGFRSWQMFVAAIFLAFALTVLLIGPLTRVLPPKLEAYRPPPWREGKKEDKFVTLFPREEVDPERPERGGQRGLEPPSDRQSANGPQKERK